MSSSRLLHSVFFSSATFSALCFQSRFRDASIVARDDPPVSTRYPYDRMPCDGPTQLTTEYMTVADYDAVSLAVTDLGFGPDSDCSTSTCRADFAGCIVRLAGHDFMDYNPEQGTGGADGCLDYNDPDNSGLDDCMRLNSRALLKAYSPFCTKISLADFFVIAAEAVMVKSRSPYENNTSRVKVDFRSRFEYGRTTSKHCAESWHRMPNPENACVANNETFVKNLGLTWSQTAALMGVHTLGRGEPTLSGYDGFWSDAYNSAIFNNDYYISMLAKGWFPEKGVGGNPYKNQWIRIDLGTNSYKEMMLDTDMCLAYKTGSFGFPPASQANCCWWVSKSLISDGVQKYNADVHCGKSGKVGSRSAQGENCCGSLPSCANSNNPQGPAAAAILTFANNEEKWIEEFYGAWKLATSRRPLAPARPLTPLAP